MRRNLLAVAMAFGAMTAPAQSQQPRQLHTNEAYVDEATQTSTLAITDPLAVFAFVLDSLPERVNVYPTENYYYFRFIHNGTPYAGNIRLAPIDRDRGKVQFGYYEDLAEWKGEGLSKSVVFDGSHDVKVEQLERLVYRLSYRGKSVVFALNDLSKVKPPPTAVGPDEKFLGPIFDESAIRFFFVYNSKLKIFHYILDETARVPEEFFPLARGGRILIGKRTGFAFYRDLRLDRKILIGAFEANSRLNNYFDGPFDHLPENFIEGEALREAIVEADPSAKGKIDRLGEFTDGSGRYLIHPYLLYRKPSDLYVFQRCATDRRIRQAAYYSCFVIDNDEQDNANPRPIALKRLSMGATKATGVRRPAKGR